MSTTEAVRAHYDEFPYPTVVNLAVPRPVAHRRRRLSYLLGRRKETAIPPDARIWVAGCGTQQAAHWGMSFPEGRVLATDLSHEVLQRAQGLADALGLAHVRFAQHDLMTSPPENDAFDLVVSTGVIHHLPSPSTGLRHLRQALKADGALQLMVYGTAQRAPLAAIRRATELLAPPEMKPEARYALAIDVLRATLAAEDTCAPLGRAALELLETYADNDPSFVADALLHPLEQTYDIDGLLALLAEGGFRHQSWQQPALWQLDGYLPDASALVAQSHERPPKDQWRLVYALSGLAAPLLEVLAVPAEAPPVAPYAMEDLDAMPLQACSEARVVAVKDGRPVGEVDVPALELNGEQLVGRPAAGYGSPRGFRLPATMAPLLSACDGTTTAGALIERFAADLGKPAVYQTLGTLLPDDIGLLVPAW